MRFITTQKELKEKLSIVKNAVPTRTVMPVLECIYIKAGEDIEIVGTSLDFELHAKIDGQVFEEGDAAIPSKSLLALISQLPDEEIILENADEGIKITCGKKNYCLPVIADKYPLINQTFSEEVEITDFAEKIKNTAFAADNNEENSVLNSVHIDLNGDMVSLNQSRIAVNNFDGVGDKSFNVPAKFLSRSPFSGDIKFAYNDKFIKLTDSNFVTYIRLLDDKYYDYKKMLAMDYAVSVKVNKGEYLESLRTLSVFVTEAEKRPVIHEISDTMKLNIVTKIGKGNEEIDVEKNGNDLKIAFNPKFLIDALTHIDDEIIEIHYNGDKKPCMISGKDYKHVILPVAIHG